MTLVLGEGDPVTVVAHGLGASLAETRALVSGLPGTRVLYEARGHGSAPLPESGGYAELADDLRAVAQAHGARQALGMSLGAATILRVLAEEPTRFDRVVLLLPAAWDRPRLVDDRASALVTALTRRDRDGVLTAVRAELPADLVAGPAARAVEAYVRARTASLLASPGLPALLAGLVGDVPVAGGVLGAVTADVLVVGQEGDPVHPAQVARDVAAALPKARLVVFDRPGMVFRERERLRALVAEHLSGTAPDG